MGSDLYVVVGAMIGPREWFRGGKRPEEIMFGPDTKEACEKYIDDDHYAQAFGGGYQGLHLTVKKSTIGYEQ